MINESQSDFIGLGTLVSGLLFIGLLAAKAEESRLLEKALTDALRDQQDNQPAIRAGRNTIRKR